VVKGSGFPPPAIVVSPVQIFEVEICCHYRIYKKLLGKERHPTLPDTTDVVEGREGVVVRVAIA
jgi:hypothetical protein